MKNVALSGISFKVGAAVVSLVLLLLGAFGYFYSHRFSREIAARSETALKLPGALLNRQLLRYESVGDRETMTAIAGPGFVDAIIFNAQGRIYYATDRALVGTNVQDMKPSPGFAPNSLPAQETLGEGKTGNDLKVVTCLTPLVAFEGAKPFFYSYVRIAREDTLAAIADVQRLFLLSSLVCILFISFGIFLFLNKIVLHPLRELQKGADAITSGKLDTPVDTGGSDEIANLAKSFERMRDAVRSQIARLEEFNQHLEETVRARTLALTVSLAELNKAQKLAKVGSWILNLETGHLQGSAEFFSIIGLPEDSRGSTLSYLEGLQHPDDKIRIGSLSLAGARGADSIPARLLLPGNTLRYVHLQREPLEEKRTILSGTIQDFTEREEKSRELMESEQRYQQLFNAMTQGVAVHEIILDEEGTPVDYRFIDVNPSFEKLLQVPREVVVGKTVRELIPDVDPAWIRKYGKVALEGTPHHEETYAKEVSRFLDVTAYSPAKGIFAVLTTDITDRKSAETEKALLHQRMLHAQKLESLGILAGGIAHDFNNLLMVILGNAGMIKESLPEASPLQVQLGYIEMASERAANLARQMLAYAGKAPLSVSTVDINGLAVEISELLGASISKRARLSLNLWADSLFALGDSAQLTQVVMNLVTNASESLGDADGVIEVCTRLEDLDDANGQGLPGGPYAVVEVSDTGTGMSEETVSRIFDPFFTTKFQGRGLGMAAVRGIVQSHHGAIRIKSAPGGGTTITVLIPAASAAALKLTKNAGPETSLAPKISKDLALVIDDETDVRLVAEAMLKRLGFKTRTAEDGEKGVELFAAGQLQYAFILLDLTMPRMDGYEVLKAVREIDRELPVILASGFSPEEVSTKIGHDPRVRILSKPYKLSALESSLASLGVI